MMAVPPVDQSYQKLKKQADQRWKALISGQEPVIHIGMATCGLAAGAQETKDTFEEALQKHSIEARTHKVGCLGHCYGEPLVVIDHPSSGFPSLMYQEVNSGKAEMLVKHYLADYDPCLEHIYGALEENELLPSVMLFSRFNREKRVIMDKCGYIDPTDIWEYIAQGGYSTLVRALGISQAELISEVQASGLRGRGGAGFPTGKKWELAAGSAQPTWVICNADEGDPGAYMDRTLLESNPHQVIEGLIICALAVEAQQGIIYVRAEYPLAVSRLSLALEQARELGLLGQGILGSEAGVEIEIFQGSGAFVCGEETALIRSVEGFRGMPVHRPPYPAQEGLFGEPTVINNVKTLATLPLIVEHGSGWFKEIGTESSPGTAIFSVVGDVVHPGLVEVSMGVTLRELIFEVCGGVPKKREFKAVQIGGPSGGCLPEAYLDTPIDFDTLKEAGAMMGSGGLVVMDERTCMVDVAKYFLDFTQKESCGKCTFCRIGTKHLLDILRRITKGEGEEQDLDNLSRLAGMVSQGSLCGLGKTASNPVLTTLSSFREEYMAHVREKRCPALMCRDLIAYYIDLEACERGCDACATHCPTEAVFTTKNRKKGIDLTLCVKCGECMAACPPEYDAVRKVSPPELAPVIKEPPQPGETEKGGLASDQNHE
ncbi:MAG: NADH-ubiquinone oxidoreductase-F iron-sulfur binding region domain-containing protein [Desulfovermiculus sp.]